ncbi:cysteine-rich CWC family protein [Cohnella cholangitidis]|uniref:Cysteine-rich CWC family protein n=1 Tax=Cohnella cholangitidis TaxID=2598458 RepID=A0A7G5BW54_9BACL|nr:cysteine-rich CWC family protein [Cohnella cholangitidis]QMV41188.1 cysteine-rich CWC family protein [Cohnella cholangitidis]
MTQQPINAARCPLCGEDNRCGNLAGLPHGACWCSRIDFPRDILKRIPDERRGKACVCQSCVEKFVSDAR